MERVKFQFRDVEGPDDGTPYAVEVAAGPRSIGIYVPGYGAATAKPGVDPIAVLEFREGDPFLVVWGDINQEDPTHTIDLSGAYEGNRQPTLTGYRKLRNTLDGKWVVQRQVVRADESHCLEVVATLDNEILADVVLDKLMTPLTAVRKWPEKQWLQPGGAG